MNIDTIAGEGTELKGQFKQALGDATADPKLQQDGVVDQLYQGSLIITHEPNRGGRWR